MFFAMGKILLAWLILYIMFTGLGASVRRLLWTRSTTSFDWLMNTWLGWCLTIATLQIWHMFFPVNSIAFWLLFVAGSIGLIWNVQLKFQFPRRFYGLGFAVLLLLIANSAIGPSVGNDYALYHEQVIKWSNAYAIVPGLANLHGRFGFNNASFLYVALTNAMPLGEIGSHVAGSFLIINFLLLGIYSLTRLFHKDFRQSILLGALTLPLATHLTTTHHLVTPTNDLPPIMLGMILGVLVWQFIEQRGNEFMLVLVAFIAITGIVTKLSFGGVAISATLVTFGLYIWDFKRIPIRSIVIVAVLGVLVIGIWLVRGVTLSGYPLYPITTFAVDVDWQVSCGWAEQEAEGIYVYARYAVDDEGRFITEGWGWLTKWSLWILQHRFVVTLPLTLFVCFLMSWVILARRLTRDLLFLIVPVSGLVFWFLGAPDPRFAISSFWLLANAAIVLVMCSLIPRNQSAVKWIVLAFVLLISIPQTTTFRLYTTDLQAPQAVEFTPLTTNSGYTVNVPNGVLDEANVFDDRCFATDIPCTPYFNPDLRLRVPDDVQSGFTNDAAVACINRFSVTIRNLFRRMSYNTGQYPDIKRSTDYENEPCTGTNLLKIGRCAG